MNRRFEQQAQALSINGTDPGADAEIYKNMDEDHLVRLGKDLFTYYLHDSYTKRFRNMLTLEQFLFCAVIVSALQRARDLSRETRGKRDQALMMRLQEFFTCPLE